MRRVRHAPTLVVLVCALALVIAAVVVPGSPAAEVRLHDGSVWVTSSSLGRVGRLNHQIDRFTTTVRQNNAEHDVIQDGSSVLTLDLRSNQLTQLDPATGTLGQPVFVPANATVALGRDTVAIVNPTNGRMWARPLAQVASLDTLRAKSDLDLGPGATATVTTTGQAIGLSVERAEIVRPGTDAAPVRVPIAMRPGDGLQISAVGERAVVLSLATRQIWIEGRGEATALPEADRALLQQPSGADEQASIERAGVLPGRTTLDAVYATATGLFGVTGGSVVPLGQGAAGRPVRPVVVAGCAWGAFEGVGATVVSACRAGEPATQNVPGIAPGAQLALRRNRDVPVLNDTRSGTVWLLDKGLKKVTEWEPAVEPVPQEGGDPTKSRTESDTPRRSPQNRPPVAKDDQIAVRAGRTTAIPVLDNDSDPDGDIVTVEEPPDVTGGTLGLVRGGTALQLTVPPDGGRELAFAYTITDGRGGRASARVRVQVLPADQNESNQPPVRRPRHDEPLEIASGGRETRRVLLDWTDPDGDDLILVGARAPGDDEVVFTPDGTLTFTDVGNVTGRKEIEVDISDGVAITRGVVVVNSRKQGEAPPRANGDFVAAAVDQEVTVRPMLNDVGERLTLAAVNLERAQNATVTADYAGGAFAFRASRPGTYYVAYTISNGPRSTGLVRVEVAESTVENRPPVAARDVALLPAGGTIQVDPLLNDEDADGDVLVLQSVGQHPDLKVEMRQRRGLQVTAETTPKRPVTLPYTVSDGKNQASGTIIVMPAPAVADPRPLAVGDEAVVRAGDSVAVNVLANDTSPAGAQLSLSPRLVEQPSPAVAWTDRDTVRFTAPRVPGEYRAVYEVRDDLGQTASAQVRFVVVDTKVENTPPQPKKVEGRVLAGSRGRILIPLQGIDPQGDAVRLLGLDSAPRIGRVVAVTEQWIEYEAYPGAAGTDAFTYAVTDARGARAVGEIRVGVVPRDAANVAPTTGDDRVTVRPGRRIRVPLLANDTDADGDRFGFVDSTIDIDRAVDPKVERDHVELTVPEGPPVQGTYHVIDARGAEASGTLVITPDPTAPFQPPVARDDVVGADRVAQQDVIDVPVLANDLDPDGDLRFAQVRVPAYDVEPNLRAVADGDRVRVKVGPTMQQVRYEVVDSDGLVATGMITVPGRADSVPARLPDVKDPVVTAGDPIDIDISGYVVGTGGRDVALVSDKRVWAAHGDLEVLDLRRLRYRPLSTYAGPSAVTFEVTDGANSSDPNGKRAVITLPTTVLARPKAGEPTAAPQKLNRPPLTQPIELKVGAGEGPKTIDLLRLVIDPDKDPVTFTKPAGDVPSGVKVDLDGTRVTAAAALTTKPGTVVKLRGEAMDDRGGRGEVIIEVVVVASARPRARAIDDLVPAATQGKQVAVPVLTNDTNPFPERGPLTLSSALVESGRGTAAMDGDKVVVTPAADFVGSMVVRYQVTDATLNPERRAEGRVRLTVRGKPGRPGVPRAAEVSDQRAVLQWTAALDNGAKVQQYTVRGTGSDGKQVSRECPSTTCTIDGLTNNSTYTFTVTATNEVGESAPSGASGGVRPDVRPEAPSAPRVDFGDRQLKLAWDPARSRGSGVTHYEVQIDNEAGGSARKATGTSLVWPNLVNGQGYRFRIRAFNLAPTPSDWSPWSNPVSPAAPPSAPSSVSAVDTASALGQEFDITWKPPARTNGDAVRRSHVLDQSGRTVATVEGSTPRARVTLALGQTYRFSVVAENKAGRSPASEASDEVKPYGAPDRPVAPRITDGVDSVSVTTPFQTRTNGAPVTKWIVRIGDRTFETADATWSGPAAVGGVTIRVRACARSRCSDWSDPSNQVTVLGKPGPPQLARGTDGVGHQTVVWRPGATGGGTITQAVLSLDGREQAVAGTGSAIAGSTIQARATARVKVFNGRHWSEWSAPLTIQNPAPVIDAARGGVTGNRTEVKASGRHLFGKTQVQCQIAIGAAGGDKKVIAVDPSQGRFDGVVVGHAPTGATDVRVVCDGLGSSGW
ncbi:Ig-like domain-containing protein [Mariniluteicoccus flavus]